MSLGALAVATAIAFKLFFPSCWYVQDSKNRNKNMDLVDFAVEDLGKFGKLKTTKMKINDYNTTSMRY